MNGMNNKVYGVWAVRGGGSVFGHAEAWCKHYGAPIEFDSKSEAQKYAAELNKNATVNCRYSVREKQHEPGAVRFPLERTPDDKVPAVGRPVHLPENYLLNAELKEEAQTGNYNMLDGRMDNLALESAAEKASVMDKLKTDKPRREPNQPSHGGKSQEREI